jgi:putative phosphoesterase
MWMVISDSHDNMEKINKAMKIAKDHNVSMIFHMGDFVSPFAILPFLKEKMKFIGVFGNNDGDRLLLQKFANGKILRSPHWLDAEGKHMYLMHEPQALYSGIKSQLYDFIFFGHTHRLTIKQYGKTLVINPGESCGYLTGKATCVLLDPKTSETRVIEL